MTISTHIGSANLNTC